MKYGVVAEVSERAQKLAFEAGWRLDQPQCLIGMRGEDQPVEAPRLAGGVTDANAVFGPLHATGRPPAQCASQSLRKSTDIDAAAPGHCPPGRAVEQIEQAVVEAEADQILGRILADPHRRSGPDSRRHRIKVAIAERPRVTAPVKVCLERAKVLASYVFARLAEKSQHVAQHRPIAGHNRLARCATRPRNPEP